MLTWVNQASIDILGSSYHADVCSRVYFSAKFDFNESFKALKRGFSSWLTAEPRSWLGLGIENQEVISEQSLRHFNFYSAYWFLHKIRSFQIKPRTANTHHVSTWL